MPKEFSTHTGFPMGHNLSMGTKPNKACKYHSGETIHSMELTLLVNGIQLMSPMEVYLHMPHLLSASQLPILLGLNRYRVHCPSWEQLQHFSQAGA